MRNWSCLPVSGPAFCYAGWLAAALVVAESAPAEVVPAGTAGYPVTVAWDANPEPGVAGYRLYYGSGRGIHPHSIDAGNFTSATISLPEPGTYYVVATAYHSGFLESLPSDELEIVVVPPDRQNPVIWDVPDGLVTLPDASVASAVVTWSEPRATDNVGVVAFSSTHQPGDTFPVGTTTVTYTAADGSGNLTSASFTVTVGGMEAWRRKAFGAGAADPLIAGERVNTDDDQWTNLGEYALGLDVSLNDGYDVFRQSLDGDMVVLDFSHNPDLPDVILRVECSHNLAAGWFSLAALRPGGEWTSAIAGITLSSVRVGERQEVILREAIGTKPAAFFRLVVESPAGQ